MSRSGYSDDWDYDQWALIRWRGAVASAIRGKRGQAFLQELRDALEALPEKRLIAHDLAVNGEVCALGAVGIRRGLDMMGVDPDDHESVAKLFGLPHSLACEIMYENDESWMRPTPEQRWRYMREWVERYIAKEPHA